MGFRRTLFLSHIVLINLVSLTIAQPNFLSSVCNDNNSTSTYRTNRDALLSSLASNTDQYGFYNSSTGENPDTVHALVLCRADTKLGVCRECINNSIAKLTELCPDGKEAIGWRDDCMLRYSNKSMEGVMQPEPSYPVWNVQRNVTSVEQFKVVLVNLLKSLGDQAAAGGSRVKFASGNATGPDSQTVYALAQCTPDISKSDCSDCIQGAIEEMPNFNYCCVGPAGGRILRPSCHFRFELGSFVGEIPATPPVSTATPPVSTTTPLVPVPVSTGGSRGLKGRAVSMAAVLLNFIGLAFVLNLLI
ncbi:cysteine-rich repeat secretory protein 38-like [Rhododendron vialii]|uniref:cysteine-rich repeat secretory protein 38-like n=1 Tax=Rhododendron vialii TaxID=182163 RepID=UPI00265F7159|nr:cysteine-rich repeat secretory protein 38-like [Rhododendron vialii]